MAVAGVGGEGWRSVRGSVGVVGGWQRVLVCSPLEGGERSTPWNAKLGITGRLRAGYEEGITAEGWMRRVQSQYGLMTPHPCVLWRAS